jgi:predicted tellurium resistance membrane protein TerC
LVISLGVSWLYLFLLEYLNTRMEELFTSAALTSVFTITLLEIILGVDNIIFISVIAGKLPPAEEKKARNWGILLAMVFRIGLLFLLGFILKLQEPIFNLQDLGLPWNIGISGKDLLILGGGLFLLYKTTYELHHKLEGEDGDKEGGKAAATLSRAILDIVMINIIFSVDSIITAVGMTTLVSVMAASIILSSAVMLAFAKPIGDFVEKHPTVKVLALSFLLLIGTLLVAEAFHVHVPKGYVYFAMAFSFFVEILNMKLRKNTTEPVQLKKHVSESK